MASKGETSKVPHKVFDTILVLDFGYLLGLSKSLQWSHNEPGRNTPT